MADEPVPKPRRKRDRAATEAALLDAAVRLLRRDGVLAGLNLQEVAAEAGVNRGQIYQIYGSRQALLRAALGRLANAGEGQGRDHFAKPFPRRARPALRWTVRRSLMAKLGALLALDGDEEFHPLPAAVHTRQALARDVADGVLPPGFDGEAAHILNMSAALGYAVFREAFARDMGIPLDELDERVLAVHRDLIDRAFPER
ncbi:TetR/AcrR family transcriptional regulator [Streptomyces sp. AV19]|uniref:TetR/AcrR family transcriptional regulator n=1 Tax=Streptomyces sp. AV19 TaxID=2793068 RepID=UPI0018FE1954|nr:TetR/AcrR family transcriptional regulator [Streptomyces sp. AV19]MBH1933478.1 TetR/AcrR family transcriptional regulator [Streptomyces sp. AV19]MDG4532127.1 TetR/AcrR family transcriptional regulator [Streptomyces sp. AV19]